MCFPCLSYHYGQRGSHNFPNDNGFLIAAYELWFKQILWELDSVREIFQNGHVSYDVAILVSFFFLENVENIISENILTSNVRIIT